MVKINGVYLHNTKTIAVLDKLTYQHDFDEDYYLCIEVKEVDSDDFYGGIAYQFSGRPFILSHGEIEGCSEVVLPCQKCAFHSKPNKHNPFCDVSLCWFKEFEPVEKKLLCFRPSCEKFHNGSWKITEIDSKEAATQICKYLSGAAVDLHGIDVDNAKYIEDYAGLKHYLSEEQLEDFARGAEDSVVFVDGYLNLLSSDIEMDEDDRDFAEALETHVYRIDEKFTYDCYCNMIVLDLSNRYKAFLLPNKKAIFQHHENVMLYDNGDFYYFKLII